MILMKFTLLFQINLIVTFFILPDTSSLTLKFRYIDCNFAFSTDRFILQLFTVCRVELCLVSKDFHDIDSEFYG